MKIGNLDMAPLTEELIPCAKRITDRYLGKDMYTEAELKRIRKLEHHYFSVLLDGEKAAAIFYCMADTADELRRECAWFPYEGDGMYGILRSIAIETSYRNAGLSEQLIDYYTGILFKRENAERIAVLAWEQNGFVPAAFCLNRCGYARGKRIERPWYERNGLKCGFCGQEHCICDGIYFEKERVRYAKEGEVQE